MAFKVPTNHLRLYARMYIALSRSGSGSQDLWCEIFRPGIPIEDCDQSLVSCSRQQSQDTQSTADVGFRATGSEAAPVGDVPPKLMPKAGST